MRMLCGLVAVAALTGSLHAQEATSIPAPDPAKALPDATVTLKGGLVSAGVGYEWGHGTVTYQGKQYAFCVRGLTVGDVGVADIDAQGVIFHMSSLQDFPGKYSAIGLGAAVIKGESTALLKNQRGVTLQLDSRVTGLQFNISGSGVRIRLAGTPGCREPNGRAR